MKLKCLLPLAILLLLISVAIHAEAQDKPSDSYSVVGEQNADSKNLLEKKFFNSSIYVSVDDQGADTDQDNLRETAIKDLDKESPYFEVGLRKKY